jgi:hypothetical protein
MADQKPQPNENVPPEPTIPDQVEMQQGQASAGAATRPASRPAPPRPPLFRK